LSLGDFIFEGDVYNKIQEVFARISKQNPEETKNVTILLSRSAVPNAFNTGDNFIVVNLGLILRLQNEDQLAFILCHELSHQLKQHGNKRIQLNAIDQTDANAIAQKKKEVAKILRSEYRIASKMDSLFIPGMMNKMQHSRMIEYEADSVGLSLLKLSGYNVAHSATLLKILDKSDRDIFDYDPNLEEVLNYINIPFNLDWIEYEEVSSLGYFEKKKSELEDSLKTHPDCPKRIQRLRYLDSSIPEVETWEIDKIDVSFLPLKKESELEIIQSFLYLENLGRAFFYCIYPLQKNPNDAYLNVSMARILAELAVAKKNRTIGKYVSTTNYDYTNHYNKTLRFLWNSSSEDCMKLSNEFIAKSQGASKSESYWVHSMMSNYYNSEKPNFLHNYKSFLEKYPNSQSKGKLEILTEKVKLLN